MVRLACKDRGNARVRRRATLLRACAVAALAVQPALAVPNHDSPGSISRDDAIVDRGPPATPPGQIQSGPNNDGSNAGGNGNGQPPTVGTPGGEPAPLTSNSGTFDVAVTPPAAEEPGKSGDSNGDRPNLPPPSAALPPPPGGAASEQIRGESQAPPAATVAAIS